MANLSKKSIALLRNAVARAKEIPEGFDMGEWVFDADDAPCGVAGCLGYEICVASGIPPKRVLSSVFVPSKAEDLIGVNCYDLFRISRWPVKFRQRYDKAKPFSLKRALILEEVVEFWITNDGNFLNGWQLSK